MTPSIIHHEDSTIVYLNIGDLTFLRGAGKAWTLLGSCVSILMYSKQHRFSAICHAQLPQKAGMPMRCFEQCSDSCIRGRSCSQDTRYVDKVIPLMMKTFTRHGIKKDTINAIIIGGASVLEGVVNIHNVGAKNVEMAKALLHGDKISIVMVDTGGNSSRQVMFDNDTGLILVNKKLLYKIW